VLIWTTTPDGRADYFNPRWLAFTGHDLHAELGEQWLASVHPDDQARLAALWQARLASGDLFQAEYRLRRADGAYRWILARAAPRRADDGTITMWVGGATDIHDQKQLVQELLETNEQQATLSEQAYQNYQLAQQQRHTLYGLLMHAPAFVSILRGPEHRYEFANEQFRRLVGNVDIVGRTETEVFPLAASQGTLALLNQVYATGEPYFGHEMRVQLDRADGSGQLREGYFNFAYQRFEESGRAAGITVYAYEVTELVKLRQALAAQQG
ncbi:MAG: PAS domain S-box protein, partial [Hymenobacter sp.]